MQFIREFNERKQVPEYEMGLLRLEERAMEDVFRNLESVGYLSGAVLIDGKIEALSIGGKINRNTVTVHVEKANTNYRGLYQLINNEFCKHVAASIPNVKYINREEDMGLPGLRKAKLSYKPCKLGGKPRCYFQRGSVVRPIRTGERESAPKERALVFLQSSCEKNN